MRNKSAKVYILGVAIFRKILDTERKKRKLTRMAQDPLFIVVVISMAAVAIILIIGIGGFGRGGEFNRKYSNKLMRMRILAQFVAVVMILLFVWSVRGGE